LNKEVALLIEKMSSGSVPLQVSSSESESIQEFGRRDILRWQRIFKGRTEEEQKTLLGRMLLWFCLEEEEKKINSE
jgi:hypothetical protein